MPSDQPLPRPLLFGAIVAGVLALSALGVAGYGALRRSPPPPARISIMAAVAELRARQAAAQNAAVPPPKASDPAPDLSAARAAYAQSADALAAAWRRLPPDRSAQLTGSERAWIRQRAADCADAPTEAASAMAVARAIAWLVCETAANRARSGWLAQAAAVAADPEPHAVVVQTAGGVCALLHRRADHVGQAVAFRGEYLTDHEGPAEVRPLGCDAAIAVSDVEPAVEAAIERADPPPWIGRRRRLVGTFTARLVQSGAEFSYDEGVRLSISGLADLRVMQAGRPRI